MKNDDGTGRELNPVGFLFALLWFCTIFGICAVCIGVGIKALRWGLA
jgi:hypothetical protein